MATTLPPEPAAELRRAPVQARGRQTVQLILDSASALLADEGLGALNTNAIAARAGISVAALYRYFDGKLSILRQLAIAVEVERDDLIAMALASFAETPDWRTWVDGLVHRLADFRVEHAAGAELRTALMVIPELRELQREYDDQRVQVLTEAFLRRSPSLDPDAARTVASVALATNPPVLDRACRDGKVDRSVVAAQVTMLTALLGTLFD